MGPTPNDAFFCYDTRYNDLGYSTSLFFFLFGFFLRLCNQ